MCKPTNAATFTPASHPICAAKLLADVSGGNPMEHVTRNHAEYDPDINAEVLCNSLLDDLREDAMDAMDVDDKDAYAAAMAARDDVVIVFADVLRSESYASAVWAAVVM